MQNGRVFLRPPRSGIWWIDYRDASGKRHREKIGKKSDASVALDRRMQEIADGKYSPPRTGNSGGTFATFAQNALQQKSLRLAALSFASDVQRLDVLLPVLGKLPVEHVTPARLEHVFGALRRRGLSGSTVNRYRSLVSSIFSIAVRAGQIPANPCSRVKPYKENESRVRYLLKDEETRLRAMIANLFPGRLAEFDLALYTGMRRGEQYTLKWKDVDFDAGLFGTLTVRGKTGRRFIVVNSSARAALQELFQSDGLAESPSAYVCPETKRDNQRDWRRWLEKAAKAANVEDFHWHDLRHTFASRLVMAGVDLRTVQSLLGHKNITMTMKYAHLSPDHRQAAAEKIGPIDKPV